MSPTVYTLAVTPTASSVANITVDIAGSAAIDGASNNSVIATQSVQAVETTAPTVVLTSSLPSPVNGAFTVTAEFSENVSSFIVGDMVVVNGSK